MIQLVNLNLDQSNISPYISNTLLTDIEEQIKLENKTILYVNKRGAFNSMICCDCSYLFTCHQCDSSLSIHSMGNKCLCHLCGHSEPLPSVCKKCSSKNLKKIGVGTQQIEESLGAYFPQANIFRFDGDTMKNKQDKKQAMEHMSSANIIIGTKMITTGFDFKNIGLIGIILIESELKIPAYNTQEKVYNNITQLLGRGSRVGQKTNYIIQTYIPNNSTIAHITQDNYKQYFLHTLSERKLFDFPPFCEMITLEYRHPNEQKSQTMIASIHKKLIQIDASDIEILHHPHSFKKHNQYFSKLIIKGRNLRDFLTHIKGNIFQDPNLSLHFQ